MYESSVPTPNTPVPPNPQPKWLIDQTYMVGRKWDVLVGAREASPLRSGGWSLWLRFFVSRLKCLFLDSCSHSPVFATQIAENCIRFCVRKLLAARDPICEVVRRWVSTKSVAWADWVKCDQVHCTCSLCGLWLELGHASTRFILLMDQILPRWWMIFLALQVLIAHPAVSFILSQPCEDWHISLANETVPNENASIKLIRPFDSTIWYTGWNMEAYGLTNCLDCGYWN